MSFYIIVNKTPDGIFNVIDNEDNATLTDSPNAIIGDSSKNGKFKVKVDIKDTNTEGYFHAGSKYFKLDLDNIDFNGLDVVNTSQSFKEKSSAPVVPVVTDGDSNNNNVNSNGVSMGGQKQKQQKSKRNYSKKRRSSKSKSDTLRNYFNYDHLQ